MGLSKHVNIRITPEVDKKIESIKKEMEKSDGMIYSRSQVIFMLIVRGIQKYVEMQIP